MGQVLGAEQALRAASSIASARISRLAVTTSRRSFGPGAQRIEHRRDAGRRDLRVVGEHGGQRRPADRRARAEVLLEMIGVEFDQARDSASSPPTSRPVSGSASLADLGDHAVATAIQPFPTTRSRRTRRALCEDEAGRDPSRRPSGVMRRRQKRVTSTMRSATRSRTSSSWKMPRMADARALLRRGSGRPRRRGWWRRARPSARRAAGRRWSATKPRAMLTRCCSPPEKVAGGSATAARGTFSRVSSVAAPGAGARPRSSAVLDGGLGDDVERADARDDAQELADIAEHRVRRRRIMRRGSAAGDVHRSRRRRATRTRPWSQR